MYITTTQDNENIYSIKIPYMAAHIVFIKWIINFFLEKKNYLTTIQNTHNRVDILPQIIQTVGGGTYQERVWELDGSGPSVQDKNHFTTFCDQRLSNPSLCSIEEEHGTVYEMVQWILLSTPDYVNFVNKVYHQNYVPTVFEN
ncbi:ral GTPase-activating protein subunit alpha-2-like [Lutra lutra]|uniref:ral GTPase-activating protein subunit alpha-2-like n=1 Tax=Lutra lutra TaxID=9657 RepID=UPI001FD057BA|nr:ral GTPase-activating protein subunit alpha-2-like [Lutra lutra]